MRNEDEIQKAHDILFTVALGEIDIGCTPQVRESMRIVVDCLCWVLNHHNNVFQENLDCVLRELAEKGYVLVEGSGPTVIRGAYGRKGLA